MLLHACGDFPGASRSFWGLQGPPGASRGLQGPPGAFQAAPGAAGPPAHLKKPKTTF